jgi:hypothetical protein
MFATITNQDDVKMPTLEPYVSPKEIEARKEREWKAREYEADRAAVYGKKKNEKKEEKREEREETPIRPEDVPEPEPKVRFADDISESGGSATSVFGGRFEPKRKRENRPVKLTGATELGEKLESIRKAKAAEKTGASKLVEDTMIVERDLFFLLGANEETAEQGGFPVRRKAITRKMEEYLKLQDEKAAGSGELMEGPQCLGLNKTHREGSYARLGQLVQRKHGQKKALEKNVEESLRDVVSKNGAKNPVKIVQNMVLHPVSIFIGVVLTKEDEKDRSTYENAAKRTGTPLRWRTLTGAPVHKYPGKDNLWIGKPDRPFEAVAMKIRLLHMAEMMGAEFDMQKKRLIVMYRIHYNKASAEKELQNYSEINADPRSSGRTPLLTDPFQIIRWKAIVSIALGNDDRVDIRPTRVSEIY